MKVWHKLVQEKFAKITLDESKASLPMKNRIKAVRSGIEICSEVYEDEVFFILHFLCVQGRGSLFLQKLRVQISFFRESVPGRRE